MNLKQSKRLLDKINALHKSISIEDESISSIERDLMLSYIRQFYEQFLEINAENHHTTPATKKILSKPKKVVIPTPPPAYTPPKIVKVPAFIKELEEEAKPAPASPPKKVVPKPITPKPIELEIVPPPPPPPVEKVEPSTVRTTSLGKYKALFGNKKATDLSEKLSLQPIKDLSRAIAINDRLLYVNDLFDKDNTTFGMAIKNLNGFNNMEEAQNLLLDYAKQYNWLDDEKEDTAHSFIKLVKRRYI